ncbi:hypothetical protein [Streptomyces shenzhenensis]
MNAHRVPPDPPGTEEGRGHGDGDESPALTEGGTADGGDGTAYGG